MKAIGWVLMLGLWISPRPGRAAETAADLDYRPALASDPLEMRLASWKGLSLHSSPDGRRIILAGRVLTWQQQRRYLSNAQAAETLDLLNRAKSERGAAQGMSMACTVGSGLVGAIFGCALAAARSQSGYLGRDVDMVEGAFIGSVLGTAAGLAMGAPMAGSRIKAAQLLQQEALEGFNRKLINDLKLEARLMSGGAALGVGAKF